MNFVYPQFLFALFSLSVPVLIHLLNFRRYKKIYFTNVALLRDIEVSSRNVRQLRNRLILLARILGLTFLVFAFAQPYIPALNSVVSNSDENKVAIFLDNSFSMQQLHDDRSQLDQAKIMVTNISKLYSSGTGFHLFTNDFRQSDFNQLRKEEFLAEIDKITLSSKSRSAEEISNRFNSILRENPESNLDIYLLSDFQQSQFNQSPVPKDTSINAHLIKVKGEVADNISLDTCWMHNPVPMIQANDSLYFQLTNYSENILNEFPVRLYINGKQRSLMTVNLQPHSSEVFTMPLQHNEFGVFNCQLEIQDNPIDFDNVLNFSYDIDSAVQVYHIGEAYPQKPFAALFSSPFIYRNDGHKNVDVSFLDKSSFIVLNNIGTISPGLITEIQNKVEKGASLILIPTDTSSRAYINEVLVSLRLETLIAFDTAKREINTIVAEAEPLQHVFEKIPDNANYPVAKGHYLLSSGKQMSHEDILNFDNGDAAIRKYTQGKGKVYLFTFGLLPSESNMSKHSLFVPLMINMAYYSKTKRGLYFEINKANLLEVKEAGANDAVYHIVGNNQDVIPETRRINGQSRIHIKDEIDLPGHYEIMSGDEVAGHLSLNLSRTESDLKSLSESELQELTSLPNDAFIKLKSGNSKEVFASLSERNSPVNFWKYCIILALMFFLSEALIIKYVKS